MVIGS